MIPKGIHKIVDWANPMHDNDNDQGLSLPDREMQALLNAFCSATRAIGLFEEEIADLLRLEVTRVPLRLNAPVLSRWREARVRHLIDVATALALLLGDEDEVACWLRTRTGRLDWMTPLDFMAGVEDGVACVRRMLLEESYHRFGPAASRCML